MYLIFLIAGALLFARLISDKSDKSVSLKNNVNSTNSKYPIKATSLLGFGTKISDDDQKI